MKTNILLLPLLFVCLHGYAQNGSAPVKICPDSLKWNAAKPPMPPGAEVTVIEGDPKSAGHFTIRIKLPAHYKLPPHTHPVDERTTVISGSISIGMGEVMDTVNARRMTAGCFYLNPANAAHYAFTNETETIVQVSTNGPWGSQLIGK